MSKSLSRRSFLGKTLAVPALLSSLPLFELGSGGFLHPQVAHASTGSGIPRGDTLCCSMVSYTDPRVYYLDRNAHVWELAYSNGQWNYGDLTANTQAFSADPDSPLCCSVVSHSYARAYYLNVGLNVQELAFDGGWHTRDVCADIQAPPARDGSPLCCSVVSDNYARVYYLDSNSHVQELAFDNGGWHNRDVTNDAQAPAAASRSSLCCTVANGNNPIKSWSNSRVYYQDSNAHIQRLAFGNNQWYSADMTAYLGAPVTTSGGPISCAIAPLVTATENLSAEHIYYLDSSSHVWELGVSQTDRRWHSTNLTPWW